MRKAIIENEDLQFYYTELQDLDEVIETEHNKENKYFVYHWSKEQHYSKIMAKDWMHIIIVKKDTRKIVGYIILEGVNSEHETIELTRITIKEKGRGYGRNAVKLVKQLCFEELGCHRLWLDVFEENQNAIHLYQSEGFIYEGTFRECKKYGDSRYSMRVFSMLKHEYFKYHSGVRK